MQFSEYQKAAERTMNSDEKSIMRPLTLNDKRLLNAAMGLAGEGGEVADHIKKYLFHGHQLDERAVVKELGDILWYVAQACKALGVTMEEVAERNIIKLETRYPDGFSTERSLRRLDEMPPFPPNIEVGNGKSITHPQNGGAALFGSRTGESL